VIEWVKLPWVPVRVIVKVPKVLLLVATVKVEVEGLGYVTVTGLGVKVQVLFVGHPVSVSATLPLKELPGVKVTLYVALEPAFTVVVVGEREIEKSGTTTTRATDVVWVRVPSVPWMVML